MTVAQDALTRRNGVSLKYRMSSPDSRYRTFIPFQRDVRSALGSSRFDFGILGLRKAQ